MARHESDREDLLREATALVERAEFVLGAPSSRTAQDESGEHVVVGFRRDGSASFYFDADPVYQFNSAGLLRRAFAEGRLYKAERGGLVALDRKDAPGEVQLVRHELDNAHAARLLADVALCLEKLCAALARGEFSVVGQVPPATDIVGRIRTWLEAHPAPIEVARVPNAK